MNSIGTLLTSGISAKKILDFFARKSPEMGQKIQSLLAQGFTAEKILKFFSKGNNDGKLRTEIESQYQTENNANPLVQSENIRSKNLGTDITSGFQRNVGPVLGTAAAGLTGYALSRAVPAIAQKVVPGIMQGPVLAPPTTSDAPIPQPNVTPIETPTPQLKAPQDALWEKIQAGDINIEGKKDDFLLAARGIRKQGGLQTKEEFDKFFQDYMANKDKYRGPALVNYLRNQFKQGYGKVEPIQQQEKSPTAQPESETFGNLALLPKGDVGTIESVKNGIARVNVDGKITNRKLADLVQSPRDAAVEALELIKSFTPEQMISTHHALNVYDDEDKSAFFLFHNGTGYKVYDISPEEYEELSTEVEEAKTSGETIIAKWAKGEGSRGSAYNKIVKGIRDRKVQKHLAKKYKKLKVGYNVFAEFQKKLSEAQKEKENE